MKIFLFIRIRNWLWNFVNTNLDSMILSISENNNKILEFCFFPQKFGRLYWEIWRTLKFKQQTQVFLLECLALTWSEPQHWNLVWDSWHSSFVSALLSRLFQNSVELLPLTLTVQSHHWATPTERPSSTVPIPRVSWSSSESVGLLYIVRECGLAVHRPRVRACCTSSESVSLLYIVRECELAVHRPRVWACCTLSESVSLPYTVFSVDHIFTFLILTSGLSMLTTNED